MSIIALDSLENITHDIKVFKDNQILGFVTRICLGSAQYEQTLPDGSMVTGHYDKLEFVSRAAQLEMNRTES